MHQLCVRRLCLRATLEDLSCWARGGGGGGGGVTTAHGKERSLAHDLRRFSIPSNAQLICVLFGICRPESSCMREWHRRL